MTRHGLTPLLFAISLIVSTQSWAYDEFNPHEHTEHSGSQDHVLVWRPNDNWRDMVVSPSHPTIQVKVCYMDKEGDDSWLDGYNFSVRMDGTQVAWVNRAQLNVPFKYPGGGYSGVINTYDIGHQGSDRYFSDVYMTFKYVQMSMSNFDLGFYGNYNQNRDRWHWCGRSYYTYTSVKVSWSESSSVWLISYMGTYISLNSNRGVGPHRAAITMKDGLGWTYPHGLLFSKNGFVNKNEWEDPSTLWQHIRVNNNNGLESLDFNYAVENDYIPQGFNLRCYVNGEEDSYFYKDFSTTYQTPHFQKASNVNALFNQWNKKCSLSWSASKYDSKAGTAGCWMILRSTDGRNFSYIGSTDAATKNYTDASCGSLPYDTRLTYKVAFVPTEWGTPSPSNWQGLLSEELSATCTCPMARSFDISNLQAEGLDDAAAFKLTWQSDIIDQGGTGAFHIWRKDSYINRWEEVTSEPSKRNCTDWSVTDRLDISAARAYSYYVTIDMLDSTFCSETITRQRLAKPDGVEQLNASKGAYSGSVRLNWTARQSAGDAVTYTLLRRPAGMNGEESHAWTRIYTTRGTDTYYSYTDQSLSNGVFYEYKVISEAKAFLDGGEFIDSIASCNYGFASLTGVISGQITYGSGTAVADARVSIQRKSDDEAQDIRSHSIRCEGGGILWTPGKESTDDWFRKRDWTIQFFVRPDQKDQPQATLLRAGSLKLGLLMSGNMAKLDINGKTLDDVSLVLDDWNCVTLAFTRNKTATVSVVNAQSGQPVSVILNKALSEDPFAANSTIVVGGGAEDGFFGNIDDVRIFGSRALSVEESNALANRMLSGNERNLVAYWPLDEGITNQQDAYDYSTNAGAANENHGSLLPSTHISDLVPPSEMLDFYAITDADGNYIIRGVPYNGSGTNYTVTPSLLSHAFSPASQDRYISANSLVYSGTDFTDVSSFPVTITVTYDGTTYPVEEVSVSIDGTPVGKEGDVLTTDIDGKVTIDVPIGSHYITVSRNGHTFVGGGRFPETGTHTFTSKAELNFYDNTTAIFAGRVVGGSNNSNQPLGFAQSTNLIGQARIRLMVTREGVGINNDNASGLPVASPRAFGLPQQNWLNTCSAVSSSENTIDIITDRLSGEFAVALPPIHYTVAGVQIVGDKEGSIRFSDVPPVDLSDVTRIKTDSIVAGSGILKFDYNESLILTHRSAPMVEVTPKGQNWFGEQVIAKYDYNTNTDYDITCYDGNAPEGTNPYVFGCPIYRQLGVYRMTVKAYELYHNFDTDVDKKDPLGSATVRIDNAMSDSCWVTAEDGLIALLASDTIRLDSLGQAEYRFRAGFPNITAAEGFRRPITVYCNVDGQTLLMDDIPYMEGIVLGSLPVPGSDFVTAGPDFIDMVLRDPPGNNSFATWRSGSTVVHSTSETNITRDGRTYHNYFSLSPTIEKTYGVGVSLTTTICPKVEHNYYNTDCTITTNGDGYTRTVTVSEDISTSNDANWDGPDADVFIGTSTNRLFCKSHVVDIRRGTDGQWRVSLKDELTDGLEFTTDFRFTAWEIKNKQIPKLREMRDALILEPQEWNEGMTNATDHLLYWSPVLKAGDRGFGEKGNYEIIEPADLNRERVLADSVDWYNTCITNWQNRLRDNESDKVLAFAEREKYLVRNISISDGVSDRNTVYTGNTSWTSEDINEEDADNHVLGGGLLICGMGDLFDSGWIDESNFINSTRTDSTLFNEFSYELLTKGLGNAITLDILDPSKAKAEDKLFAHRSYSPIFRTRGGSTSGFYEPEYRAEFFEPEKKHLIMEGTVQTHVPELTGTDGVYLYTGIPAESTAKIHLTMKNLSGIGLNGYYTLYLDAGSNPEGASYTVDGTPLEQGVSYYFTYGQPLYATVECRQVNPDILEYNPVFYLADPDQPVWTGVHGAIADSTVREKAIHIEFARMSSNIELTCDASHVNAGTPGCKLPVTLSAYNCQSTRLRTISLEYYNTALDTWTTLRAWTRRPELDPELIPLAVDEASITTDIDFNDTPFLNDRTYRFRAATTSWFGSEKATTYSEEISIVKDMEAPRVMAVSPADGWMNANTEVSVTFNEDIDESITASNVHLRGVMAGQPIAHEVSLNTNSTTLNTNSEVLIPDGTGTITLWMKRMKDMASNIRLLSINGENNLELHVSYGRLVAAFGQERVLSSQPLPDLGEWLYLILAFERDSETGITTFSAGYTTDNETVTLIAPQELPESCGLRSGIMEFGPNCRFHDVCVWDDCRSIHDAASYAHAQIKTFTPHLIEYWPMNSLQGRVAQGQIGHNDILLTNDADWVVERENYAIHCLDNVRYEIPLHSCSTSEGEDYHIQMWYRFDGVDKGATIFSYGDSEGRRISVETDPSTGEPFIQWNGGKNIVGVPGDLTEGNWYRFDLVAEKSRNKSAIVYLDDQPCSLIPYNAIPNLEGWLTIGGNGVGICVDEFRVWRHVLDAETMRQNMYSSLNTAFSEVCLYYPFEEVASQNGTEKTYAFSLHNRVNPGPESDIRVVGASEPIVESINVPPVKGAPEFSNVGFSLSRSERKFVLNIDEPQQNIEGSTLYAQIQGLKDKAGNTLTEDVAWHFQVALNNLKWNDASLRLSSTETDNQIVLNEGLCSQTVSFINNSSVNQGWYITGLPSWLEADIQSGSLKPGEKQAIRFLANGSTLTGTHSGKIYLIESETGISHSLTYSMSYLPDLPDWKVDRTNIPNTMNIIGQVTMGNVIQSNPYSLLAAFDSEEHCAGVASLESVNDYGSCFVQMTLYGDAAESDSLTFCYYDANTGTLYPVMLSTLNGEMRSIRFIPDDVVGSFVQPVIFSTTSLIRQTISRDVEGWDYFSFFVEPESLEVTHFLDNAAALPEDFSLRIVHSDGFALYENGTWLTDGTFERFAPATSYKIWNSAPFSVHFVGDKINPNLTPVTIVPGWNWLGTVIPSRIPLAQAFSHLKSEEGDFVKDYYAAAICEKVGNTSRWQGKLKALTPGSGYLYHYEGLSPITFLYPKMTLTGSLSAFEISEQRSETAQLRSSAVSPSSHYGEIDTHASSGVMPVVAQVLIDKVPVTQCEVAAFDAENRLCGAARPSADSKQGLVLLLLHGEGEQKMRLEVVLNFDNQTVTVPVETPLDFTDNALLGTMAQPYKLHLTREQIKEITGLESLRYDEELPMYDVSGRRVGQPVRNAVTITGKEKVITKNL